MPEGRVIAVSGPLVAVLVQEDLHHSWAVEQFQKLPAPFLTCEAVLTETFYLVHRLKHGKEKFLDLLGSGVLTLDFALMAEQETLGKLIRKYADVPMSLAMPAWCAWPRYQREPLCSPWTGTSGFIESMAVG